MCFNFSSKHSQKVCFLRWHTDTHMHREREREREREIEKERGANAIIHLYMIPSDTNLYLIFYIKVLHDEIFC